MLFVIIFLMLVTFVIHIKKCYTIQKFAKDDYMGKITDKIKSTEESTFKTNFYKGLTAFLVIASAILFYFIMLRISYIIRFVGKILTILLPITYGFVIAYLLNPIMVKLEHSINKRLCTFVKGEKMLFMISRGIAIFISISLALVSVAFLVGTVIPELVSSLASLVTDLPSQWGSFLEHMDNLSHKNKFVALAYNSLIERGGSYLEEFLSNNLSSKLNAGISFLANGIVGAINFVTNFIIGIVVAIYIMAGKERFAAQSKKLLYAFLPVNVTGSFIDSVRKSHKIFGGFITGKIIDSIIVGILCFISLKIMDMPYTVLVSVIVGVTNIIPFFGPYIGAIPSAFLILIVDPWKGIYFIIFIIILQQIDGNIIGPAILGPSTGLSEFWVMFSLLLGGGLFGVVGMIIGTPAFAVFYFLFRDYINKRLEARNMPVESDNYMNKDKLVLNEENGSYEICEFETITKESKLKKTISKVTKDKSPSQ